MSLQLSLFNPTREEAFWQFHREHPEVYEELKRRAFEAKAARMKRCGIRMLWERMRWYFAIENRPDDDYKLNDHYTRFYSRLLMAREPELVGFFEVRER
jgi:hypothetical protein